MPKPIPVDPAAAELVRRAIAVSGLNKKEFAAEIVVTSEKQLYRWLNGTRQPPKPVVDKLRALIGS